MQKQAPTKPEQFVEPKSNTHATNTTTTKVSIVGHTRVQTKKQLEFSLNLTHLSDQSPSDQSNSRIKGTDPMIRKPGAISSSDEWSYKLESQRGRAIEEQIPLLEQLKESYTSPSLIRRCSEHNKSTTSRAITE